ncbi:beta-lactamase family protein [Streptomyces sp. NBC_00237]|uniref:serine hydrolase domain-containing protein n=1 Tax=Streptomyces sp. NBC_00237 TaxID=2975687 RepID=UPI002259D2B3|nr:serine hydrolase domain-containing protein [Streptomyces sp. NBC_00237]MCX5203888.1 beta-lactamase family protein [Streptomyces sp. NBC_00237]
MSARTRTALAAALVLGIAAGPVAAAGPAFAGTPVTAQATAAAQEETGPNTTALQAALAGLPNASTTAALVRVGGKGRAWQGSSGVHDLRSNRPANPNGRFRIGSVTKVFTAATVLRLAEEGRVSLDRPVRAYLPDLIPAAYGEVTVRQLLNHTHGIPSPDSTPGGIEELYAHRFDLRDPRAMVADSTSKAKEKDRKTPGTVQEYSNTGYTIAGLLIERVAGTSYEEAVARRVLRPLGLRDTYSPGRSPRIRGPYNHGYQVFPRPDGSTELRDVSAWTVTDTWAAGDLVSTTADLERFMKALFGGEVVRGPLLEEMFTVPDIEGATMSAGLQKREAGNGLIVWLKTGGRWGYNAIIAAPRDLSRTLVYSVNSTDAKGEGMNPTAERVVRAAFSR